MNTEKTRWGNHSSQLLEIKSKTNRKKTRKILYQELYAATFCINNKEDFYESFYNDIFNFSRDDDYLDEITKIIYFYEYFFIFVIKKYSPKFNFEKMNVINIIPIYMALAEMFYLKEEIPAKVSINEAVEVAKTYWDNSAKKIVNWVLNKVYENYEELNNSKESIDKKDYTYSIFKK